jgi:hypothetical protein
MYCVQDIDSLDQNITLLAQNFVCGICGELSQMTEYIKSYLPQHFMGMF